MTWVESRVRHGASSLAIALAMAILLVVGTAVPARAVTEGDLDVGFESDGWVQTPIGTVSAAHAVAIQPDGKIVAAGYSTDSVTANDTTVVRYNADGSLDQGFGAGGIRVTQVIQYLDDQANAVAIQSDGRIVVAGTVYNGRDDDFFVARYTPDGALDTTFGSQGIATLAIGSSTDRVTGLALDAGGRIVVAGYFFNGSNDDMAVVRYRPNGSLDPTFDTDGIVSTMARLGSNTDRANAVAIQPDGKIVLAGYTTYDTDETTLVRLDRNGSFDAGFGDAGIRTDFWPGQEGATGVAVQPDGEIVAVIAAVYDQTHLVHVARHAVDGSRIATESPFRQLQVASPTSIALQPDGRLLVSGEIACGFDVGRLLRSGHADGTFGHLGLATCLPFDELRYPLRANAVAVQTDGKVVAAGIFGGHFGLMRWLGDLTPPWGARLIDVPRYFVSARNTVSWIASDTGAGVESFDVQRRHAAHDESAYSAWSTWLPRTPNVYGTFTGTPGSTYCLRVRGRDFAGNVGVYSPPSCGAIPLDERTMSAAGSWSNLGGPSYYLGTAMSSTSGGARLTIDATYRHLAVVVTTCPDCGTLRVFRGTRLLREVSLTSATTRHSRVIQVDASSDARSGTITLRQSSPGEMVILEGLAISLA